jgi:hypothetical protein
VIASVALLPFALGMGIDVFAATFVAINPAAALLAGISAAALDFHLRPA